MRQVKRNRLESFSAREFDDPLDLDMLEDDFAPPATPRKPGHRQRGLSLQIALGIWLGGMALMITWLLVFILAGSLLNGDFSIRIDGLPPQQEQPLQPPVPGRD